MGSPRTNLVAPLTSFVGRAEDLAAIEERFDAGERLVTITGAAGIGKTRLAKQVAPRRHELLARGGVWFCDLSDARDQEAIAAVVGNALGVPVAGRGEAASAVERIGDAIGAREPSLIVLDNFEQATAHAAETVGAWLASASEARFLVTSRERLRLDGECVVPLGPLGLPDDAATPEESDAFRLLLDRVRRVRHGFRLGEQDVAVAARIVAELDGIPLAIELAAPRLAMLGARGLLERMTERLRALDSGSRGAKAKATTLESAIEWSWNLLTEVEKSALAQASVFRGGFDVDAADATIALPDGAPPLLDVLQSLFDKSLLRAEGARDDEADGRFGLYHSIRDFADDRLRRSGDAVACETRHARYYATTGLERAHATHGPEGVEARSWLAREKQNLETLVERNVDPVLALDAVIALEPLAAIEGPLLPYLALLDRALSAGDGARVITARIARGNVYRQVGRLDEAARDLGAARDAARAAGEDGLEGRALTGLATVALVRGELPESDALYASGIALLARAGERSYEATAMSSHGAVLAAQGRLEEARELEERALAIHGELGNLREEGMVTAFLGNLCIDAGRFGDARVCFAQASAIHERVGDRFGHAFTTGNIAILEQRIGNLARARTEHLRAIAVFDELGARRYAGAFRGYLGLVDREEGDYAAARTRLTEATAQLTSARDDRFAALFSAHLAGTLALLGEREQADRLLTSAERTIAETEDPFLSLAVRLQRVPLAVAAARAAQAEGRIDHAKDAYAEATRILEEAESPTRMVRDSADVCFSLRLAESALGRPSQLPPLADAFADATWPEDALVVEANGAWFRPPGEARIDLARREALSRALAALTRARDERPGRTLAREDLIAAIWPGERILRSAAQNRLRVAISTLRRLGLADAILTRPNGYAIDPNLELVVWRGGTARRDVSHAESSEA